MRVMQLRTICSIVLLMSTAALFGRPTLSAPMLHDEDEPHKLFEYPVSPDAMTTQRAQSRWQLKHFWDPMDFNASSVDQEALNNAFRVYANYIRYASDADVLESVNSLVKKVKKNPVMTLQFAEAAEAGLYGPKADIWCDAAYIPFLKAAVGQKKLPASRRKRYEQQLRTMSKSVLGSVAPGFEYKDTKDEKRRFKPGKRWTLIEFGDPKNDLSNYSKQRLESDPKFNDYLKQGRIEAYFIIPDPDDYWELTFGTDPSLVNYGAAPGIGEVYDIRAFPSFYLIGLDKRIYLKHVPSNDVIAFFTELFDKEDELKSVRKKHFKFDK